jgi:16S rRNA (adenine1518-N6/adenine1519-N6)-dimethyltransferase
MTPAYPLPKKHFGQHFLTNPYYGRRIALAVPAKSDECIVEIGPGTGALSVFLKERFPSFHCIERDPDVIPALRQKLGQGSYAIHEGNALDFDLAQVENPCHVVGNLPYSVGAIIIKKFFLEAGNVASATFMVQQEVARRIVAGPHSKTRGYLSVFCQFFGTPKLLFTVPAGAFFPRPKVTSAVFQIVFESTCYSRILRMDWKRFFLFVSAGFSMRRKKLANSLEPSQGAKVSGAIAQVGLDANCRAEDLSVESWIALFKTLAAC